MIYYRHKFFVGLQSLDLPPAKKWSFEQQSEVTPLQPVSYKETPFNDRMWIPDTKRCSSPISESERTLVDEEVYEEVETFDLNEWVKGLLFSKA